MFRVKPFLCLSFVRTIVLSLVLLALGSRIVPSESFGNEPGSEGEQLFQTYCASCHNFKNDAIGPRLSEVISSFGEPWVRAFVKSPQAMIEKGDERALALSQIYGTVMPTFAITDEEIDSIVEFVKTKQKRSRRKHREPTRDDALKDPIVGGVELSNLVLDIEKVITLPRSSEIIPFAKINKLAAVNSPSGQRLFINDMRGKLYELEGASYRVVLDLAELESNFFASSGLATGFASFAFSPDFEESGLLYTNHSEVPVSKEGDFKLIDSTKVDIQAIVTEWKFDDSGEKVDVGSRREILRIDMPDTSHGMQELAFNPYSELGDGDYGLLYIGVGDGGSSYLRRPDLFASPGLALGKILRIDPRGNDGRNGRYGVPLANYGLGLKLGEGALPEVVASGFRNPNTLSWHPNGTLLASDIGHGNVEEVNVIEFGADYGWPLLEGTFEIDLFGPQGEVYPRREGVAPDAIDPAVQLDHSEIVAIVGGRVYAGAKHPLLFNRYLFGGIVKGRIFTSDTSEVETGKLGEPREIRLRFKGEETSMQRLVRNERADLRICSDGEDEIYLMSKTDGSVWRVVEVSELN